MAAILVLCLPAAPLRAAEDFSVEAYRRGAAVEVIAHATIEAPIDLVWRTLTDYDGLAAFVPGIRRSRVLERHGREVVVEQEGEARFLFFRFPIEVTVSATESPPDAIAVRVLKGNLKRLEGGYRIERATRAGLLVLHWRGLIQPEASLPPLFGEVIMRTSIEAQFAGMVREIERRQAAAPR